MVQIKTPAIAGDVLPAQADVAHHVQARIREHVRLVRTVWIRLAEDLYQFNELQMWRDLGLNSFEEWLAGPDIDLERRWVYDHIAMWRELVINRGVTAAQLEPVQISKVREVLPAIRRGYVDVESALSDCEVLPRRDLEQKYRGMATASDTPGRPAGGDALDADAEPEFAICHACGSRYPVRRAA